MFTYTFQHSAKRVRVILFGCTYVYTFYVDANRTQTFTYKREFAIQEIFRKGRRNIFALEQGRKQTRGSQSLRNFLDALIACNGTSPPPNTVFYSHNNELTSCIVFHSHWERFGKQAKASGVKMDTHARNQNCVTEAGKQTALLRFPFPLEHLASWWKIEQKDKKE